MLSRYARISLLCALVSGCESQMQGRNSASRMRQTEEVGRLSTDVLVALAACASRKDWYAGGSLHDAKMADWYAASYANRLATTADFLSHHLVKVRRVQFSSIDDLRRPSLELCYCMNKAGRVGIADTRERISVVAERCIAIMEQTPGSAVRRAAAQ